MLDRPFSAPPGNKINDTPKNKPQDKMFDTIGENKDAKRGHLFGESIIFKNVLIDTSYLLDSGLNVKRLIDHAFNECNSNVYASKKPLSLIERIDQDHPQSHSTEYTGVSGSCTPIGSDVYGAKSGQFNYHGDNAAKLNFNNFNLNNYHKLIDYNNVNNFDYNIKNLNLDNNPINGHNCHNNNYSNNNYSHINNYSNNNYSHINNYCHNNNYGHIKTYSNINTFSNNNYSNNNYSHIKTYNNNINTYSNNNTLNINCYVNNFPNKPFINKIGNTPFVDNNEPLLSNIRTSEDILVEMANFVAANNIPMTDDICITLCKHQEGSRFLQKRLEVFSQEEYLWFFNSIKHRLVDLSVDLFGNYVVQKIFDTAVLFDSGIRESGSCNRGINNSVTDRYVNNYVTDRAVNHDHKNNDDCGINYNDEQNEYHEFNDDTGNLNFGQHIVSELLALLKGKILILSLHMYGCRVIQKALESADDLSLIIHELQDDITTLIEDQNGNHVVQKCVEKLGDKRFLIREFESNYLYLCNHKYGCRVIQRLFEACEEEAMIYEGSNSNEGGGNSNEIISVETGGSSRTNYICPPDSDCSKLVDLIIDDYSSLIVNQYGNYVLQHIIEKHPYSRKLVGKILPDSYRYSMHKFASNVIEKCVAKSPNEYFQEFIKTEKSGKPFLVIMAMDKFANYVVQRIYEFLGNRDRQTFKNVMHKFMVELRKNSYAKHIVSKML